MKRTTPTDLRTLAGHIAEPIKAKISEDTYARLVDCIYTALGLAMMNAVLRDKIAPITTAVFAPFRKSGEISPDDCDIIAKRFSGVLAGFTAGDMH
jgi:hypothetical protein